MTTKLKHGLAGLIAASALTLAGTAVAQEGVKVGVLDCKVSGGVSFVFGSSKKLDCTFLPAADRPAERYKGEVQSYGVDIGFTSEGMMVWAVFAPAADVAPGALQGGYGGVTAAVAAGAGMGTNVLLGGGNDSIALQPLSIEGLKGLNVAAGVKGIKLNHVE